MGKFLSGTKKVSITRILLWFVIIAFIGAIYILSGQEGAISHKLSKGVVKEAKIYIKLPEVLKHYKAELGLSYEKILRKSAHFTIFFLLAILFYAAYKGKSKRRALVLTFFCCAFFASMDELHQMFVAGRTARFTDVIIDMSGASIAILLLAIFSKNPQKFIKR